MEGQMSLFHTDAYKRIRLSRTEKLQIGTKCANCGSTKDIQYHHIVPISLGGHDEMSNIVCLCGECHRLLHFKRSGNIDLSDAIRRGIQKARSEGRPNGRRRLFDREGAMQIIAERSSQFGLGRVIAEEEVCSLIGCKMTTYCQIKRELAEDMRKDNWSHSFKKPDVCLKHAGFYRRGKWVSSEQADNGNKH